MNDPMPMRVVGADKSHGGLRRARAGFIGSMLRALQNVSDEDCDELVRMALYEVEATLKARKDDRKTPTLLEHWFS